MSTHKRKLKIVASIVTSFKKMYLRVICVLGPILPSLGLGYLRKSKMCLQLDGYSVVLKFTQPSLTKHFPAAGQKGLPSMWSSPSHEHLLFIH